MLFALLSSSASDGAPGKRRSENTLLGILAVAAVVFVTARAGLPWVGVGLALLWTAAKRLGGGERAPRRAKAADGAPPSGERAVMTREEAYEVLGLSVGATPEEILGAYRRLMKKVHPDQGGTTYLATRLNQAKDVLLS